MDLATSEPNAPLAGLLSYEDLYSRWERQQWSATELDFSEDAKQWKELSDFERRAALWNYALFFWGEDSVADNLSPYIDAAPREEQKYFLATQQVDEARHAIFFKRFIHEVCGVGDGTVAGSLRGIEPLLTPGFTHVFSKLDRVSNSLRKDGSKPNLAAAITLYHLVVESMLAQPGQHMIEDYLGKRDLFPAFRAGIENVARDEQRHIAFGVKILSDLREEDSAVPAAVAEILRNILPWASQVLMPPNWDEEYLTIFGYTFDQIGETAVTSIQGKLRAAGLSVESLPGRPVMLPGMDPLEIAQRGRELAQAGIVGYRSGPSSRDEQTLEILFDTLKRQLSSSNNSFKPAVYGWEFTDSDINDWQLTVIGSNATVSSGPDKAPDLTFRISYQDWADIIGKRLNPIKAAATGRLRLRGKLLLLPQLMSALN